MAKPVKVGGQISGGSTSLGKLSQKGTKGKVGSGASKASLGYTKMLNRNLAAREVNSNLSRGAYD